MSSSDDNGSFSSLFSSCFGSSSKESDRSIAGKTSENIIDEPKEDITQAGSVMKNEAPSVATSAVKQQPTNKLMTFPIIKEDEWTQIPKPMANCPLGLEKLLFVDTVFVRRLPKKLGEKRYGVFNDKGEQVYLFKQCIQKDGTSPIRVVDQQMLLIWFIKQKRGETSIYTEKGTKLISVARDDRNLLIYQKEKTSIMLTVEPVSVGSHAIRAQDGNSIGTMQVLSDTDRMASWPMDLLVEAKAACLVALLLLEALPTANPNMNQMVANLGGPIGARPIVMQPVVKAYKKWFPDFTGSWAPQPPPTADCPPGLEQFLVLDHAFLKARRTTGVRTQYDALNRNGDKIIFVEELIAKRSYRDTGGFERVLEYRAYNRQHKEVWAFGRTEFCCCETYIDIVLPPRNKVVIMTNNARHMKIYPQKAKKPALVVVFAQQGFAHIKSPNGRNIGEIWTGQDSARHFHARWPMELPVLLKLACFQAMIMMDIFYFDPRSQREADPHQYYH